MADPREIGVGAVLSGTYEVLSLLGRGGMGTVWGASHLRLPGKRVAIKVLHSSSANDESYARFRREAEIASRIGHPNIVDVLDWNLLENGTPYLVLEFLDGESLAARLSRGKIPLEETSLIVRQLGSALHAAHRAGIVHRDLKPDNIFLCPTDVDGHVAHRVKVLDFGISKIRNSTTFQTQEARVLGTPQYMAPEQARGRNQDVDERTDVFALGAIVYEMLAGRPAFEGAELATVVFKVVYEEPDPLATVAPEVPPQVAAAVHRALSKEREKRQPDVLTFVAEMTGRPLDTLDRAAIRISKSGPSPFAATEASAVAHGTPASLSSGTAGGAAGQVSGPTAATAPSSKKKTRAWVWAVAVLVLGGAGTTIGVLASRAPDGGGGGLPGPTTPAVLPPAAPAKPPPTLPPPTTPTAPQPPTTPAALPPATPPAARADAGAAAAASAPDAARRVAAADAAPAAAPAATPDAAPVVAAPADAGPVAATTTPDAGTRATAKRPPKPDEPEPPPPPAVRAELQQAERALASGDYSGAVRMARHTLPERKTAHAYSIMARAYCGLRDLGNAKAALQNVAGLERMRVYRQCAKMGFRID